MGCEMCNMAANCFCRSPAQRARVAKAKQVHNPFERKLKANFCLAKLGPVVAVLQTTKKSYTILLDWLRIQEPTCFVGSLRYSQDRPFRDML